MSVQTVSDVLTIALNKAMTTKLAAYVNTFSYKLNAAHGIDAKEIVALWNEVNNEMPIKFKKEDTKKEKKNKQTCPYIAQAGKNKGMECGKVCKGDFCSAHSPDKLAKDKAKREARKAEKQSASESEEDKGEKSEEVKKDNKKEKKLSKREVESDDDTSDVSDTDSD
jgi:hypothetical protein